MARQKVGNRITIGLGLNDGIPEQARVIEWVRASGKTPSEVLWEAVLLRMDGTVPSEIVMSAPQPMSRELSDLRDELMREINSLRAELRELRSTAAAMPVRHEAAEAAPSAEPGREITQEEAMRIFRNVSRGPGIRLEQ